MSFCRGYLGLGAECLGIERVTPLLPDSLARGHGSGLQRCVSPWQCLSTALPLSQAWAYSWEGEEKQGGNS